MKPEDLQKAPKQFCENIKVGFTPEYFIMGLSSGAHANIYALSAGHMKRLAQYLTNQVEQYEEKHGHIDAEWNPNVPSPLQQDISGDLKD
ncbi:MAG: DUF3467 domain-containing protein [Candidatus Pacebacteria bacterium]|nr:DUF3467 domain-containing protein [Candidatus Paceibacterota bacterium]